MTSLYTIMPWCEISNLREVRTSLIRGEDQLHEKYRFHVRKLGEKKREWYIGGTFMIGVVQAQITGMGLAVRMKTSWSLNFVPKKNRRDRNRTTYACNSWHQLCSDGRQYMTVSMITQDRGEIWPNISLFENVWLLFWKCWCEKKNWPIILGIQMNDWSCNKIVFSKSLAYSSKWVVNCHQQHSQHLSVLEIDRWFSVLVDSP